jgi:hypothetical protein
MKKREDKGRLSPFVPLLIETLDAPAWRAVSHGAARLYIALRRRYSPHRHNNGHIYLSLRVAHKELRSDPKQIARWFRELEHYGFIVMTTQGYLGIDGKGKAPHWRLTELGTPLGQPTRDFLSWKGGKFRASKIQNPEGEITHSVRVKSPTPMRVKSPTPPPLSEGEITHISEPPTVGEITLVTRACLQLSKIVRAASCTPARKFLASLS